MIFWQMLFAMGVEGASRPWAGKLQWTLQIWHIPKNSEMDIKTYEKEGRESCPLFDADKIVSPIDTQEY